MKKEWPHIAIIILNWNGLQDTMECLVSVFKNNYPNYSVYIVDNHSKEDELSKLKEWIKKELHPEVSPQGPNELNGPHGPIIFLQNTRNLGFAGGNNTGIRQALNKGADYIFTLNNDTETDRHFLSEALNTIEKSKTQNPKSKIGIISTKMVNYYDRTILDNTGHDLLSTGDTIPRGRNLKAKSLFESERRGLVPQSRGQKPKATPMGACAGAALYSGKMLQDIGLFDSEFFLNYEDSDLSLRAIARGWAVAYSPKSIIYHKINASIKKVKDSKYRIRSQRNQLWAYLHNTPFLVILLNLPWIILRDLLVFLILIITFRWTITWIFIRSRFEVLRTLPKIIKKRRKVMKKKQVSSIWFWQQQKSFLKTYWEYFLEIVIRRKSSVME